jgi:hypothetical protein
MAAADLVLDCPGKSDGAVAAEARPRPLVLPRASSTLYINFYYHIVFTLTLGRVAPAR